MKKLSTLILVFSLLSISINAQVGINTETPDPSSALEVKSNDKGVLLPRMTESERDLIANPAEGLLIYNTTCKSLDFYSGSEWKHNTECVTDTGGGVPDQNKEIIIGSTQAGGSTETAAPVYFSNDRKATWSAMIYNKNLVTRSGDISKISFLIDYNNSSSCEAITSNQKVYMKLVDEDTFSNSSDEDTSTMTEVFSGSVTWKKGKGDKDPAWSEINLDTAFAYDKSKNLLIYYVNDFKENPSCVGGYFGGPSFLADSNGNNNSQKVTKKSPYDYYSSNSLSNQSPVLKLNFK